MQFTKRLREPIRDGEITKTVRIWKSPRVKVGNAYALPPGRAIVESIQEIELANINQTLARETGFSSVAELLKLAQHGSGTHIYLIEFRYEAP